MKCYAYLRVSGIGQIDGDGFARQLSAIKRYAKHHRLSIVKVYREKGVTGTIEERPALTDLMLDLEENGSGVKTVIIEKIDRLARDLMIQESIIRDFQKQNFNLISALEGDKLLSDDPTRELIRKVLGCFSEYEKKMVVAKLKSARDRVKARTGKCEGRKGYREINPELIRMIKKLRRKPKGRPRQSFQKIAETLNEKGVSSISGQPWSRQMLAKLINPKKKRR